MLSDILVRAYLEGAADASNGKAANSRSRPGSMWHVHYSNGFEDKIEYMSWGDASSPQTIERLKNNGREP